MRTRAIAPVLVLAALVGYDWHRYIRKSGKQKLGTTFPQKGVPNFRNLAVALRRLKAAGEQPVRSLNCFEKT